MKNESVKSYLTIKDAAFYLSISADYLYHLVAQRKISSYRIGRRVLLKKKDLDEMMESSIRKAF